MKLSTQRCVVLGSTLACLAVSGLAVQRFHVAQAPQLVAQQDAGDEPEAVQLGHGYERRGDSIFFDGKRIDRAGRAELDFFEQWLERPVQPANAVDAASFEVLSEQYTKDEFQVYFKYIGTNDWFLVIKMPDADPETFEVLDSNLAKDERSVWWTDFTLPGADPATAEVVSGGMVWRDRNTVYYQSEPLPGADPMTIVHLDHSYHRDSKNVFWGTERLRGADAASFRTFGDMPYAADKDRVWFATSPNGDFDVASFRVFHNHVYADKNGVYVSGSPLSGADVETFEKVGAIGDKTGVLFRDRESLFVFESEYHIEMYRISKDGGDIVLNKDIWRSRADGKTVRAAYVNATWEGGGFSKPVVTVAPGFKNSVFEGLEKEKIEWFAQTFKAAIEQTGFADER